MSAPDPSGPTRRLACVRAPLLLCFLASAAVATFGWHLFWYLTDDAFITFRYVSNSMLGRGLVWNPPPFLPVDGNTDFLWSIVLRWTWAATGIEPPVAANWLLLLFGYVTLALVTILAWRLPLPPMVERRRLLLLVLVLSAVVGNRVFLASLSSGMGKAMFDCCCTWWVLLAVVPQSPRNNRWLAVAAAMCALCRPDGYPMVAATAALLWYRNAGRITGAGLGRHPGLRRTLLQGLPLLALPALLLWRRSYYGEWLPNAYYAKHVSAWPESGLRYCASFVLEYGVWVWLAIAVVWLAHAARDVTRRRPPFDANVAVVVAVLGFHFVYSTFVVGGDLFEYRIYSHLVPLLPVALLAMARDLWPRPRPIVAAVLGFVLAGLPLSWGKYLIGDGPVAPHAPAVVRPLLQHYDAWQDWLHAHEVCLRNGFLRDACLGLQRDLPTRAEGMRLTWDERPVLVRGAVGIAGWVLPDVAILDTWGLNDWVIARNPIGTREERAAGVTSVLGNWFVRFDHDGDGRIVTGDVEAGLLDLMPELAERPAELQQHVGELFAFDLDRDGAVTRDELLQLANPTGERRMAHDRFPPEGYLEGFLPNVEIRDAKVHVRARQRPLTDEAIRTHEAQWRARFGG